MRSLSYFDKAFTKVDDMVLEAMYSLEGVNYDTMIGTGLSGSVAIPVLARELGKSFAIIRKEGDGSHSGAILEGIVGERWLFVDDFISSGETLSRVIHKMRMATRFETPSLRPMFVGSYEYQKSKYSTKYELRYRGLALLWKTGTEFFIGVCGKWRFQNEFIFSHI